MSKKVIACDVDEVFFPFLENFLNSYNDENGTDITPEAFNEYHFHGPLGLTVSETVDKVYDYLRKDLSHIQPLYGVENAIERLSAKYDLEIVTARHPEFEVQTWRWLQEKLPDKFRAIKLIGYAPMQEKPIKKADVCVEIGAFALIDDSVNHIAECAEIGIEGILFGDYPWNQVEQLPKNVTRCINWQEVAEHFNV